jgi:hypothetical protein
MLDLATAKWGVDLFKQLLGFIVTSRQAERDRLTHQSGIKMTFLLYQTAGGAMTAG